MAVSIRKLATTGPGNTYYLSIPRDIIKNLKWKKGEKKTVRQEGQSIVIEDWEES